MNKFRSYQAVCEHCEPKPEQPGDPDHWKGLRCGKVAASNAVRIHDETAHGGHSKAEIREVER